MSKKIPQPLYELIFLFITVLFIRFPFFFRDYIDHDESTFILMGQSIADGHLPYDHLWDLKPPLLFYLFALIEEIFPHSFVAIRLSGTIIIFLSAWLLLKIAKQANLRNGFFIALGYIIFSSELGKFQGVMSEHLAVFFMLAGFYLLITHKNTWYLLVAGILFGCSLMCKLNYAYALVILLIYFLVTEWKKDGMRAILLPFWVGTGTMLSLVLIASPFILTGKIEMFINSVFRAPLEYSSALHLSTAEKLGQTWYTIILTIILAYASARAAKKENRFFVFSTIIILIGTVYTFYTSGIARSHYLILIYPFLFMLIFGVLVRKKISLKPAFTALLVIVLSYEAIGEYYHLIASRNNPAEYRPAFEVISELKKRNLDQEKVFFAYYHIGYWLLNQYPLTKSTTHPTNIGRPFLFKYFNSPGKTSLEELKYIFEKVQPNIIVARHSTAGLFPEKSAEGSYIQTILEQDFKMIYSDDSDDIYIWQRK